MVMVVPRNLKASTSLTVVLFIVRVASGGGDLEKSTTISTVLSGLSSGLCSEHHSARSVTVCLYADSSLPFMRPNTDVSSAYLITLMVGLVEMQSLVYSRYKNEDSTHPWGGPLCL